MERFFGLIAFCIALAGCVGHTRGFSDDAKFQRYIAELELSSLPVVAASAKLSSEGFTCASAENEPVVCEKTVSNSYGWQRQRVNLTKGAQGGTLAAADLMTVVM